MTDQKSRWASIRQMLHRFADKDAAPKHQQQHSCSSSDSSDPENIPDQPVQIPPLQRMSQLMNLPRWEDREEMYKRHINDLEQELTKASKNKKALSYHLYEMGCVVFPEMNPCDSISLSFVEKLKVYLECLLLEREQLEKRALWAERTVWEVRNDETDLEKLLYNCDYQRTHHMEHWSTLDDLPAPPSLPSHPFRSFSKMFRKSPENKAAAQSPGKWAEEFFDEVAPPKQRPGEEAVGKSPWRSPIKQGSTEARNCAPPVMRAISSEYRLPKAFSHFRAGSCWPLPEQSQHCTTRAPVGYGDPCIAQAQVHWDPHLMREQGLEQCAEVNHLSTAKTLLVATPSAGDREGIKISPDSSVSLDVNPTLQESKMENSNIWSEKQHLATVEGNCEIKQEEGGFTNKEDKFVTLGSISLEPVGLAGQVPENLRDAQTDPQKLDYPKAKTFQNLSGHATFQTEVSFPGKDSPKSGQNQSISFAHSSSKTADLEPEQVYSSLDLLQKPGKELSSLELSSKTDLPASSIKALETNEPLGEKKVLEDALGLSNKSNQPIPMEENTIVAYSPRLKPEELLPADLYDALSSVLESPQPASLMEQSF